MVLQVNPMMMGVKKAGEGPTGLLTVANFFFGLASGYSDGGLFEAFGDFIGSLAGFDATDVSAILYISGEEISAVYILNGPEDDLSLTIDDTTEVLFYFAEDEGYSAYFVGGDPFDLQNKIGQTLPVSGEFI